MPTTPRPARSRSTSVRRARNRGGVENFFTRATVDISEFEGSSGQLGPSATFVDDEFFCQEGAAKYVNAKYAFKTFSLSFDMVNRLQDSRQVGAQSEGGGGGGFGGLGLDVNDIQMQEFILEFPNVGSASDMGLEKNRKFSMLAESGGGGAIFSVPIFESGDFPNLKTLHKQLVRERAGLQNYNQQARRTEISIIAEIYVKGKTLGDRPIESNHIEFPITICGEGCGTTDRCVFREDSG